MIQVSRLPKPPVLVKNATVWRNALVKASTQREKERALSKYRHPHIR
jgi:hypothetical protein